MERENHFAYSSADFLACSGYYQADVEKANHRCLQYVTAQLGRGSLNLNLLEMKRTRLWRHLPSQTTFWLFTFLGHKYSSVCLHAYHFCNIIVHPPTQLLAFFITWLLCHPHLKSISLYSEEGDTWGFWLVVTSLPSATIVVFFCYNLLFLVIPTNYIL